VQREWKNEEKLPGEIRRVIERFVGFVREAFEYFEISQPEIFLEIGERVCGIDLEESTENELFLGVGIEPVSNSQNSRRIAWHETCHWENALNGKPTLLKRRPKYKKLDYYLFDGKLKKQVHENLLPKRLETEESEALYRRFYNVISDVIVAKRIVKSPVFKSTLIGLTEELMSWEPLSIRRTDLGYACKRVAAIAMEIEYAFPPMNMPRKHIHRLRKTEKAQLQKIFQVFPHLEPTYNALRSLFEEIIFTTDVQKFHSWIMDGLSTFPSEALPFMAREYINDLSSMGVETQVS